MRTIVMILLGAAGTAVAWPCDCGAPKPACASFGADAIFLGRVSFTNDDGSGGFSQATLVRFDVEESFKGIAPEMKEVWVDPGSFTSCYEDYRLGERYLIVAHRKRQFPGDSATVSLTPGGGKRKPLPPGINPADPPVIYWSPACSGSRPADRFPNIEMDYAMLRAYRAGKALPRAIGRVYLTPFQGLARVEWATTQGGTRHHFTCRNHASNYDAARRLVRFARRADRKLLSQC